MTDEQAPRASTRTPIEQAIALLDARIEEYGAKQNQAPWKVRERGLRALKDVRAELAKVANRPSLDALLAHLQQYPAWSVYAACNIVHGAPFRLSVRMDVNFAHYGLSGSGDDLAAAWAELGARMKGEPWPPQ